MWSAASPWPKAMQESSLPQPSNADFPIFHTSRSMKTVKLEKMETSNMMLRCVSSWLKQITELWKDRGGSCKWNFLWPSLVTEFTEASIVQASGNAKLGGNNLEKNQGALKNAWRTLNPEEEETNRMMFYSTNISSDEVFCCISC